MTREILRLREAGSRRQPAVVDPIRPADEIRRAHNLLVDLLLDGDLRAQVVNLPDLPRVLAVCDALCWVLLHRHNNRFAGNLASIEARLESLGIGVSREVDISVALGKRVSSGILRQAGGGGDRVARPDQPP
jgi:hypothetical protein